MNYLNTDIESIAGELSASKKYNCLHPDTIKNVLALELQKHKSPKPALKSTRKKLHLILADYLQELNFNKTAKELNNAFAEGDPEKIENTCLLIMNKHASTRERIPVLPELYAGIFAVTGIPQKLADLACALNPFTLRWMNLPPDTHYYAFDNNNKIIDLLRQYLALENINYTAEWRDVLCNPPEIAFDVAFLFKMYHCLEHRRKGAGWDVIENTDTQWAAVSFPTRNLANRKVDIFGNYRDTLIDNIKKKNWDFQILEFDTEIVLLICLRQPGGSF